MLAPDTGVVCPYRATLLLETLRYASTFVDCPIMRLQERTGQDITEKNILMQAEFLALE